MTADGDTPHEPGSHSFKHVFTPKHVGSLEDYYILEGVLGEGSFGTILKGRAKDGPTFCMKDEGNCAEDEEVEAPLRAIKTVSSDVKPYRFEREVMIQRELDHPNVAKLYEVFKDKIKFYLVLELCTGGELFERIVEAGGAFSEGMGARYVTQLLHAVNYLHNHHFVHRDLKPENLLLQNKAEDAPLKVIDFGCARSFTPGQAMTTGIGTPLYLAPQVLFGSYNEKCDIWSCGAITYVLLSGVAPFMGPDENAIYERIKSGSFDFDEMEDITEEAMDIITQMLTMDPDVRPSAKTLLDHAWLGCHSAEGGSGFTKDIILRLRAFKAASQFKKVALSLAAQLERDEDIQELQSTFITLDTDSSGSLTYTEIADGLTSHGVSLPSDLSELLSAVDTDGSGSIDYTEFIASTLTRRQYLREEVLWASFRTFDLDGDGKISREEFAQVVAMSDKEDIAKIFEEADLNGDDQIDFQELCCMMRKAN